MGNDYRRHVIGLREVSEPLKRLQHDEQRQAWARLAGPFDGERQFVRCRRKGVRKLGPVGAHAKPGVSGIGERGHL